MGSEGVRQSEEKSISQYLILYCLHRNLSEILMFYSIFQMAAKNDRGLVYQCLDCGKFDQRGRLQRHIYLAHVEKGNIPFYCALCSFCTDSLPGMNNHLDSAIHQKNASRLEGSFSKESFVNIAGDASIYLQEGKHYKSLTPEESEKVWETRRRPVQRTVTASTSGQQTPPTLTCTVGNLDDLETIDFSDLMRFDETPATLLQDVQVPTPPTVKMTTPKAPIVNSPVISIRASPAPSSSSDSSNSEAEQLELLRAIARSNERVEAQGQLQIDVLTALNKNLELNNQILSNLHDWLKDQKEQQGQQEKKEPKEKARSRSRSRSPRRKVSPRKHSYSSHHAPYYRGADYRR